MIKCSKWYFEAKSEFGLKAHMRKHKDEPAEQEINSNNTSATTTYTGPGEEVVITQETKLITQKKTSIELIDNEGNVAFFFSLEKNGQDWLKLALMVAEKKQLKLNA